MSIQDLFEPPVRALGVTIPNDQSHCFELPDPEEWQKKKAVPLEDRFVLLTDVKYTSRKTNRLKRLIHNAKLEQSDICIAGINYTSGRKLNKSLINRLATCEYIAEYRNIFITGSTGSSKTYMACAFGMDACKQYFTVKYIRLPDLLLDLESTRNEGCFAKAISKYTKPLLLIIMAMNQPQ